ncbi:MAG: dTDP-4-dehydrorhamnose reductase [Rhodospirillales bacterium]|nr:dTDP-4-dehydrorhamnose reductase [Rhodospirillales bacterium]
MRILVTGVTGQVGSALTRKLAAFGIVVPASRTVLDLTQPQDIASRLDDIAPDVIVNPAAYTAVDRAEDERDLAFRVNAEAPRALAEWSARRRIPLLHFSTDYVYSGRGTTPWKEGDETGPLSIYGASKLAGEAAIREVAGQHLIARTSWVYAPTGSNFLRTMVRLAQEREELRVVADQIGAPTSATIIADALAAFFASPEGVSGVIQRADGLLHVAATGSTSWHGFATAIVEGLRARGVPLKVERVVAIGTADYPTKAHRPINSRLDLSKLSEVLGHSTPDWSAGLATVLDEFVVSGIKSPI